MKTTLDYFGLVSQSDLVLTPALCSMLFQLLIFLPQKFPARSSKPVFLFALSFLRLKVFRLHFPQFVGVCRPLIYEQVRELGVKLRHVVHED